MGILEVLTLIFVVLKLTGVIAWSWWLVLLPVMISIAWWFLLLGTHIIAVIQTSRKF
ncbi:transmembrane Fragile-X-F protein [Bacillus licheniformis]|uniref:transmembrane Fragile-X-F protein n=1 Tax=Bacillus licheniformis TaxID=1402 RepID=UPI00119F53A6|nr:transmembrane Fragile-X-F protein [Bacillus licheniformis]